LQPAVQIKQVSLFAGSQYGAGFFFCFDAS